MGRLACRRVYLCIPFLKVFPIKRNCSKNLGNPYTGIHGIHENAEKGRGKGR